MIILVNYFNMLNLTYVGFSIKWHVNEVYALFSMRMLSETTSLPSFAVAELEPLADPCTLFPPTQNESM